MGHVGLLSEVEPAVVKLLLVVDERRQRERLLPVVFVRGFQVRNMDVDERRQRERLLPVVFVRDFQVRNMDSSLALVYENDS